MTLQEKEAQIRMLDDPSKRVTQLAQELSDKLGISAAKCKRYLYTKRWGYDSPSEQQAYQGTRRQLGKRYTLKHFRLEKARELGFNSLDDYQLFLEDQGFFFHSEVVEKKRQKVFEYAQIQSQNPGQMDRRVPAQEGYLCEEDKKVFYDFISSVLTERQFQVLTQRYFEGLKLEEIGQSLGQTAARAGQIVEESIERLKYEPTRSKLREFI